MIDSEPPLVSVVVAARNEAASIARCLQSIQDQDYPYQRIEVVVVVSGGDRTAAIVAVFAAADRRIHMLRIDDGRTPVALNTGVRASRGSVVARVDAHGWIDRGYLSAGVERLSRCDVAAVGGLVRFVGHGQLGRSVALAMASPVAAGTAAFRRASKEAEAEADTLMWGMYPTELLRRLGGFDEALVRNQDDELCYRIRTAGGRLVVTPTMTFSHMARPHLRGLWQQYWEWGRFRVHTLAKHGRPASVRQVVPAATVAALLASVLALVPRRTRRVGAASCAAYVIAVNLGSVPTARRNQSLRLLPLVGLAAAVMHVAYGSAFWLESYRWMRSRHGLLGRAFENRE